MLGREEAARVCAAAYPGQRVMVRAVPPDLPEAGSIGLAAFDADKDKRRYAGSCCA